MGTIASLVVKLSADMGELVSGSKETRDHLHQINDAVKDSQTAMTALESGSRDAARGLAAFDAELAELAKQGHISTEQIKELRAEFQQGFAEGLKAEAEALKDNTGEMNNLHGAFQKFDGVLAAAGVHIAPEIRALGELGEAAKTGASGLGAFATAGLVASTALAAWKLGEKISDATGLGRAISDGTAALMGWGDAIIQGAGAGTDAIALAFQRTGIYAKDAADALALNTKWLKEHNAAAKEANDHAKQAAKEYEQWAAAMVELNSAGDGWKGTLDTINGSVVEAIKYYLQAGVSQHALATAYDLSATQVKAVASALQAETAAQKEQEALLKQYAATLAEVHAIEGGRHTNLMSWFNQEIAKGKERFEQEMGHLKAWRDAYAAEEGVKKSQFDRNAGPTAPDAGLAAATTRDQQLGKLDQQQAAFPNIDFNASRQKIWQDFDAAIGKATQSATSVAGAHTTAAGAGTAATLGLSSAGVAGGDLANVFNRVGQGMGGTQEGRGGMTDEQLRRSGYRDEHGDVTMQGAFFGYGYRPGSVSPFGTAGGPHRALGGPVGAGQPYTVGELGPETFVPDQGGTILPRGGGGGSLSVSVNVSGILLSSDPGGRAQLRAVVKDAVVEAAKNVTKLRGA